MGERIFYAIAVTVYCAVFVWLFVCAVWRTIDEERQLKQPSPARGDATEKF